MLLNGKSWIVLAALALGVVIGLTFTFGRIGAAEKRAAVAEGRALEAIQRATGHERAANELKAQNGALEAKFRSQVVAADEWRRRAQAAQVPGPRPIPQDPQVAAFDLRSVGLPSALALSDGTSLNLKDSGTVIGWGFEVPALRQKQIAQSGLIGALDSQVGTLSSQKALSFAENGELRAANGDLRLAADQYKVAYDQTGEALKAERRIGTWKIIGTATVTAGVSYIIWHK